MGNFLAVLIVAVIYLIRIIQFFICVRAVFSWNSAFTGKFGRIYQFLCFVTEPVIAPVRAILSNISALRNLPIDFSSLIAFLLLTLISSLLTVLLF